MFDKLTPRLLDVLVRLASNLMASLIVVAKRAQDEVAPMLCRAKAMANVMELAAAQERTDAAH
jgi:hypothetical protein